MKKAYYLSSCSTCDRILKEVKGHHFQLQDIKSDPIMEEHIDQMYQFTNSYEALFSKRARKYKSMGLKDQNLKEEDFKKLILEEYTFLKRPVFILGHEIFVGNSKKTIDGLKKCLANE
ncbi:MAG: arsenate reductase family protein [Flavobacteriales bacterium]